MLQGTIEKSVGGTSHLQSLQSKQKTETFRQKRTTHDLSVFYAFMTDHPSDDDVAHVEERLARRDMKVVALDQRQAHGWRAIDARKRQRMSRKYAPGLRSADN